MSELGNVYHHARDVLDRINPERWAAARNQQQQQPGYPARRKRQAPRPFADIVPRHRSKLVFFFLMTIHDNQT